MYRIMYCVKKGVVYGLGVGAALFALYIGVLSIPRSYVGVLVAAAMLVVLSVYFRIAEEIYR